VSVVLATAGTTDDRLGYESYSSHDGGATSVSRHPVIGEASPQFNLPALPA
jgi:hypothetical protein